MTTWRALHMLALFWMMAGIGNVVVLIWTSWSTDDIDVKSLLLSQAQRNEMTWMLPGVIAAGLTGFGWAAASDLNVLTTGWLLALELIFAVDVFIFLPLMGVGLRRVQLLALQAKKRGEVSDDLRDALADNVPMVFGTLIMASVPIMVWLPVYKPF